MAVGMQGFMGIGVESTGGTASSSVPVVDFLPFVSENLVVIRNDLPDPSIWNNYDERRMYNGQQRVEGTIQTVFHPILTGYLLRMAFDAHSTHVGSAGGVFGQFATSVAGVRIHRFLTGQTQFQAGSGSDLPTTTIEINRGPLINAGSSFMYYNCTARALEMSIEAGGFARCNVEVIGRDYSGKSRSTPSYIPQDAFLWDSASVSMEGTGSSLFQSLTVRIENNIEAIAKLDGRLRPDLLKRGDFRRIQVNGTTIFQSFGEYDRFQSGSEVPLRTTFTGKGIGGVNAEKLDIDVPRFRYSTYAPAIAGPGPIQISFTGRGMIDQTSLYSLAVTIVNTRVSGYHVNTTA